jgi:putative membrane protein
MNSAINLFILQIIAIAITSGIIPGLRITSFLGPILMVAGISALNYYLWDRTLFEAIPNNLSSKAITLLFANGFFFWLLVKLLPGIEVDGFLPALAGPIVFTVVSLLVREYGTQVNWEGLSISIKHFLSESKIHLLPSSVLMSPKVLTL